MIVPNLLDTLDPPIDDLEWALTQSHHYFTLHLRSTFGEPGEWSDWRPYDRMSEHTWSAHSHKYASFYYKNEYGRDISLRSHEYETHETTVEGIEYDYKKHWWSIPKERIYTHVEKAYRIRHRPTRKHDLTHDFEFTGVEFSRPPEAREVHRAASALLAVYESRTEENEQR